MFHRSGPGGALLPVAGGASPPWGLTPKSHTLSHRGGCWATSGRCSRDDEATAPDDVPARLPSHPAPDVHRPTSTLTVRPDAHRPARYSSSARYLPSARCSKTWARSPTQAVIDPRCARRAHGANDRRVVSRESSPRPDVVRRGQEGEVLVEMRGCGLQLREAGARAVSKNVQRRGCRGQSAARGC
jgi:hypothetical protein